MNPPSFENVLYSSGDGIAWITVNRPERRNALDRKTSRELLHAARLSQDDPSVRVVLVTGAGDRAFVAGADITELAGMTPTEAEAFSAELGHTLAALEGSRKPVIAVVNGFALGGGCELAMACHVRLAADTAQFGQPEVGLGLIPGAGGTQRLARLVGLGRALHLVLTGEVIPAQEAWRIGLVNRVVPAARLRDEAQAYATELLSKSPTALALALEAVHRGADLPLERALRLETALFGLAFATEDMREGTRAFLERRKPRFTGK
jgi:enoyl-CoA hydratase